jgi:hypothetical protein
MVYDIENRKLRTGLQSVIAVGLDSETIHQIVLRDLLVFVVMFHSYDYVAPLMPTLCILVSFDHLLQRI